MVGSVEDNERIARNIGLQARRTISPGPRLRRSYVLTITCFPSHDPVATAWSLACGLPGSIALIELGGVVRLVEVAIVY